MKKHFRLWLTENEGYNMLNEAVPFWKRMHMSPSVPPPMAAHAPVDAPVEPSETVDSVANDLANELGITEQVGKSNYLKRALHHVVSIMHPKVGSGGKVIFAPMAAITDAVIRNAMKDKELDPDEDETLKMASSPVTLINHLRLLWGKFHNGTSLEGSTGNRQDNDRWFTSQDAQYRQARLGKYAQGYKSWHDKPEEAPAVAPTGAKAPTPPNMVLGIMNAMPEYLYRGADMVKVSNIANKVAQERNLPAPTEAELLQFMKKKGFIGTMEWVSPSI